MSDFPIINEQTKAIEPQEGFVCPINGVLHAYRNGKWVQLMVSYNLRNNGNGGWKYGAHSHHFEDMEMLKDACAMDAIFRRLDNEIQLLGRRNENT